jgi:hypothetical protein
MDFALAALQIICMQAWANGAPQKWCLRGTDTGEHYLSVQSKHTPILRVQCDTRSPRKSTAATAVRTNYHDDVVKMSQRSESSAATQSTVFIYHLLPAHILKILSSVVSSHGVGLGLRQSARLACYRCTETRHEWTHGVRPKIQTLRLIMTATRQLRKMPLRATGKGRRHSRGFAQVYRVMTSQSLCAHLEDVVAVDYGVEDGENGIDARH